MVEHPEARTTEHKEVAVIEKSVAEKMASGECVHCFGGVVYEPTEDALVDEAHECHMCMGTTRKMGREERKAIKADRDLDAHYASLERLGG